MLFVEWYEKYLKLYKRDLKPKTLEGYNHIFRAFLAPIQNKELSTISADDLQEIINAVLDQAGSRQAQITFALLHGCFARAVRSDHLDRNPADRIDKPKHQQEQGRALTDQDLEELLPEINQHMALALMLHAGLRRGEVLGLQWGDIDLTRREIHVRRSRVRVDHKLTTQTPKSAAGIRTIPISAELLPILRAAYQIKPQKFLVDLAPETIAHHWRQIQEGIRNPYRLHDLRHTYATRLRLKGCNLSVLQYLMGHSSYKLTADTYTHVGAAEAQREFERITKSF